MRLVSVWETFTTNGRHYCVLAAIFCIYWMNKPLRPAYLYVMIGLFNDVRKTILRFMLNAVRNTIQAKVSLERMEVLFVENCMIYKRNHNSTYTIDCSLHIKLTCNHLLGHLKIPTFWPSLPFPAHNYTSLWK